MATHRNTVERAIDDRVEPGISQLLAMISLISFLFAAAHAFAAHQGADESEAKNEIVCASSWSIGYLRGPMSGFRAALSPQGFGGVAPDQVTMRGRRSNVWQRRSARRGGSRSSRRKAIEAALDDVAAMPVLLALPALARGQRSPASLPRGSRG